MTPKRNKQVEANDDYVEHLWDEALDLGTVSQSDYDHHWGLDDDDDDDDTE
jgi:hypothetical protein